MFPSQQELYFYFDLHTIPLASICFTRYSYPSSYINTQKKPVSAVTTDTGKIAARLQLFYRKKNP